MVTILACIFVFGILVSVHEFGHFITAKLTGMRVDEFAIGFGPKIINFRKGETLYSLRMIPLGGYNKIAGMDPGEECDDRGFGSKSIPARMLVILAGAMMNFILPVFIFFGIFTISGIDMPVQEPYIGQVMESQPAYKAGLRSGDLVLDVNGKKISDWADLQRNIRAVKDGDISISVLRDKKELTMDIVPEINPDTGKPFIGIVAATEHVKVGPLTAVELSVKGVANMVSRMYSMLYQMVTGEAGAQIAGPVGVAKLAGEAAEQGFVLLLQFTALLSLNLAIINLLPLPALDGGHFILLLWEAVTGRKPGEKFMSYVQGAGLVLILGITIFATFKDLTR